MRVVLVDDSKSALAALNAALCEIDGIELSAFIDPADAIAFCLETPVDLLLVDYRMPKYNGIELITELRKNAAYQLIPIIMITSERDRSILIAAIEAGVTEFIGKPFDTIELQARVRNLLALRRAQVEISDHAERLVEEVAKATEELASREEEIIWRLARAIEYRDGDTGDHISRVAQISRLLAQDIGLDKKLCRMIYLAAPLHDVGKIGISDSVLHKPGCLTAEEITEMRRHVEIGVGILERGTSELLRIAETIAGGHHEKWDGTGYPKGISGENIPIEARIVAVSDVFEALCSERPYKKAWPVEDARQYILSERGCHFDPRCVEAFDRQWSHIQALMGPHTAIPAAPPLQADIADYISLQPVQQTTFEKI